MERSVRLDALGAMTDAPPPVRAMFASDEAAEPLPEPGPQEWLSIHDERGQTFHQFVRTAARPARSERTMYLQPVDTQGALSETCLATLASFAGAFFLFHTLEPCLIGTREMQPYAALASASGMTEGAVKMAVCRLRERYRECLKEEIGHTVASPAEVDGELRHLFRVLDRG